MREKRVHMKDLDRCLICGAFIGKGNDPAICGRRKCGSSYRVECEFNKSVREIPGWSDAQIKRYGSLYKNKENWERRIE